MKNNLGLSWSDLRYNPGNIINAGYKIIFLPYATIFVFTFLVGALGNLLAYYAGVRLDLIRYKAVPGVVIFTIFLLISREVIHRAGALVARRRSLNPNVKILEEVNTLSFKLDDAVVYTAAVVVRPATADVDEMAFLVGWNGDLGDVRVINADGCNVHLSHRPEGTGLALKVSFGRRLRKNSVYSFEFSIEFNNHAKLIRRFLRKIQPYLPERTLTQTLILEDAPQRRFIEAVYSSAAIERPISERFVVSDDTRHAFVIRRPIQGFSYKIAAQASGVPLAEGAMAAHPEQ